MNGVSGVVGVAGRRPSRQEINRRRGRAGFVGRRGELAVFRETFARNPEEVDFPYLFHVYGNGGVGKSTLVRQWEATARERASVVTAFVDDEVRDALEAMETVSARLGRQGHPLKRFDKQAATYRQRRHQAESTAPAQQPVTGEPGIAAPAPASPSSTVVAQVGLVGLGMLPGVGAFAGAVDPQQVALGADRMRAMLNMRLRSHDDVQLVMKPVEKLTPVFLEDLADVAERCERVVLFFDVYERTGPVLDAWLQSVIFGEDHEGLPVNVQIVLSGQLRLDLRGWGDRLGQVTEVGLDVFTEEEARTLLATHDVTDEQSIELVLRLSGRLPLLVDMLARSDPNTRDGIGDPSETAVERFLKWEPDAQRREAALACALPLQLDEDIYRAVVPEAAADGYPWLRALAFVSRQAGRCRYHDVVRDTMLRLQRTQSPAQWQQQHTRLANTFEQWRLAAEAGLGTDADEYWDDAAWREHRLNETYHRLCASPRTALPDALLQAVEATDHDIATLRRWAQILTQAGHDTETATLTSQGQRLETAGEQERATIAVLTLLLTAPELDTAARALAHSVRAREYRTAGDYEQALADYAVAQRIAPDVARGHGGRGETYRLMGRYDEALSDFTRAIELDPRADWVIASRAETYQAMERYDEALSDFTRAIELNPRYAWATGCRALTYRTMGRYDEALIDFTRAIEIDPRYVWVIASRGETYRLMERYDEALIDFTRAIEINLQYVWAIASRAETYRTMGRYDEALIDFTRAIELDPRYAWAIASRAGTYQAMERYDEALIDFTRAIEINPRYAWAIASRAETYQAMERYDEALIDFTRAIEINPRYVWAIASRAGTYRLMGRYDEALTDYTGAIELDPQADWVIANRGETYRLMGRYDEALIDFTRAIELDPRYAWAIASRAETYQAMERYDEALTDFTAAIEVAPRYTWAIAARAGIQLLLGRYGDALADCARAIELDPLDGWHQCTNAVALRLAGQEEEADAYFQRAIHTFTSTSTGDSSAAMPAREGLFIVYCAIPDWDSATAQLEALLSDGAPQDLIREALDDLSFLRQLLPETGSNTDPLMRRLREALDEEA